MNVTEGRLGMPQPDEAVLQALQLLGKRRLVLAIHDSCFPAIPGSDIGRGSPYSEEAKSFLAFARRLGFNAIQLGPQGQTPRDNPSPYDGTLFSRNSLNLDLVSIASTTHDKIYSSLLPQDTLQALIDARPVTDALHTQHAYAFDACHKSLDSVYKNFIERRAQGDTQAKHLDTAIAKFTAQHAQWLQPDALFHSLAASHGWRHQRDWPVINEACPDANLYLHDAHQEEICAARRAMLFTTHQQAMEQYSLGQFILHQQHAEFRMTLNHWGLKIYGDLQVGISACDAWSRGNFYLQNYLMGAPPSRTNPEGQPWGYSVLDPQQYLAPDGTAGPVLNFLKTRIKKLLDEFDGLRLDHPHGLVCPWVYRRDDIDPMHAVQHGARLFSSPQLADHPALGKFAIVRGDQINTSLPRYADDWVQSLEPQQIERYALLLDGLLEIMHQQGISNQDVLCEVLSTLPYPLACVIQRHGLGRFRVTQKADLDNPADVYRSENANPADWIMVGNHDTPPIWRLVRQWLEDGQARQQAGYLAQRLVPEHEREDFTQTLLSDRRKLVHAKLADIFASRSENVMIFFADLLGMEQIYNRPGIIHPENWTLRVPPDFATEYAKNTARGEAINLPCVLALALRARGDAFIQAHHELIEQLQKLGGWWDGTNG